MGRSQELKASSAPQVPRYDATTRFFPPRLEHEFHTGASDFQDFVLSGAHDLLERATKGERVDFKLIPIEKKMLELRLIGGGGGGIRIYCTRAKNSQVIVLGFGTKTSQKQDILTAYDRYRNLAASE
jgi:putative component of toxin-antitoxin plasmid stabilization module